MHESGSNNIRFTIRLSEAQCVERSEHLLVRFLGGGTCLRVFLSPTGARILLMLFQNSTGYYFSGRQCAYFSKFISKFNQRYYFSGRRLAYFARFKFNRCYYFSGRRHAHQQRGACGNFFNLGNLIDQSLEDAHRY